MKHFIKVPAPESHGLLFTDVTEAVRFWSKVEVKGPDECWMFTGTIDDGGYGQFRYGGKLGTAHRLAYADSIGPVPSGSGVGQTCGQHACCNPRHLTLTSRGRPARGLSSSTGFQTSV
jgi:hypothetical protein